MYVAFYITKFQEKVNDNLRHISQIKNQSNLYYLVSLDADYSQDNYRILSEYGYREIQDFIFRKHKPIVLENYDLAKGRYSDQYGNTIDGWGAVIGNITFKGCNNHITLGKEIGGAVNLDFVLYSNTNIEIGDKTKFNGKTRIEVIGYDAGNSSFIVKNNCRFTNALIRIYNNPYTSSVLINEKCTFETNLEIHANSGKKITISRDCMFSSDIELWAGDGHTVFDVRTGQNTNASVGSLPSRKDSIVIGEHVWVAKGAFIMHGTNVGNGSIIGAKSVVKGKYPNNCSIAGNPAKIVSKNVAWSREMLATDMHKQCGGEEYVKFTDNM